MRSSSLREARRAGENTTHSHPMVSARQATKMAMLRSQRSCVSLGEAGGHQHRVGSACLKVLPKRRGVEMSTSPGVVFQLCFFMMAGRCVPHESR